MDREPKRKVLLTGSWRPGPGWRGEGGRREEGHRVVGGRGTELVPEGGRAGVGGLVTDTWVVSEGGCASAASGDLRSGAPHTILSHPVLYNPILSYDKQRFLTPGHQGWNDLHRLCRIGMEYYLPNNDNNINNSNNNNNNNNNKTMMMMMIIIIRMMTMMIIGTTTIINDNDYNHNNDTNNDNNENDNDKNSSDSMPVTV